MKKFNQEFLGKIVAGAAVGAVLALHLLPGTKTEEESNYSDIINQDLSEAQALIGKINALSNILVTNYLDNKIERGELENYLDDMICEASSGLIINQEKFKIYEDIYLEIIEQNTTL